MAKQKLKWTSFVSPVGMAKFAWLNKPDTGHDGKADPKFKVRILLEDTPEHRSWCENVITQSQADTKLNGLKLKKVFHTPFHYPEDQDEDDFIPAEGKDKPKLDEDHREKIFFDLKTGYAPGLVDTALQSLPEGVYVFAGDDIRVKFEGVGFEGLGSGISFRLQTVQLVQKNGEFNKGPRTDGFGEIDGYVSGVQAPDEEEEDF